MEERKIILEWHTGKWWQNFSLVYYSFKKKAFTEVSPEARSIALDARCFQLDVSVRMQLKVFMYSFNKQIRFHFETFIEPRHNCLFYFYTKDCEKPGQQITGHLSKPKWVFHHGWRRTMVSPILQIRAQWKQITGAGPACRTCPGGGTSPLSQRRTVRNRGEREKVKGR